MRARPTTLKRAKKMRRELTPPELILWSRLKGRQLDGLHFRVQHPIGPYIPDFYCAKAKLAVEVDGFSHAAADQAEHDHRRDVWLAERGVLTLRFAAMDVRKDLHMVLGTISVRATALNRLAGVAQVRRGEVGFAEGAQVVADAEDGDIEFAGAAPQQHQGRAHQEPRHQHR